MRYVISYDLNAPEHVNDYKRLHKALADLGAKKVLYSQWCLRHDNTSASKLAEHFWNRMDKNDRLLVASLDNEEWCAYRMMNKISEM